MKKISLLSNLNILLFIINIISTIKSEKKSFLPKYPELIRKLKNNEFNKIVFLVGAGISTSSGIPDFRSKNGIFEIVQKKYDLENPTKFFDIDYFYENPKLFYDFSKEFYSKDYQPSIFHYFMGFINQKNLLYYIFTQNIDNLESKLKIDKNKIIYAHGNLYEARCPKCQKDYDFSYYLDYVLGDKILYCKNCGSPVKSNVIFYGESLSDDFFVKSFDILNADLIIIAGTSLEVPPFNKLAYAHTSPDSYRIVFNKIRVGKKYVPMRGFDYEDIYSRDFLFLGDCDEKILFLLKELDWEEDFFDYMKKMKS